MERRFSFEKMNSDTGGFTFRVSVGSSQGFGIPQTCGSQVTVAISQVEVQTFEVIQLQLRSEEHQKNLSGHKFARWVFRSCGSGLAVGLTLSVRSRGVCSVPLQHCCLCTPRCFSHRVNGTTRPLPFHEAYQVSKHAMTLRVTSSLGQAAASPNLCYLWTVLPLTRPFSGCYF